MFRRSRTALAAAALAVSSLALVAHAGEFSNLDVGKVKIEAAASGLGKFDGDLSSVTVKETGGKLVFTANLTCGLDMGVRDSDTRKKFKIGDKDLCDDKQGNKDKLAFGKLTVDKDKLKVPEDKKEVSSSVPGTLKLPTGEIPVKVDYTVSRTGSDYHIKSAKFTFDYTKAVPKICLPGGIVCVKPDVTVRLGKMRLREK
jgi:hypothetical protein